MLPCISYIIFAAVASRVHDAHPAQGGSANKTGHSDDAWGRETSPSDGRDVQEIDASSCSARRHVFQRSFARGCRAVECDALAVRSIS